MSSFLPAEIQAATMTWHATCLTLFPEMFRARSACRWPGARSLRAFGAASDDIRAQATDRHRTVDDTPFAAAPAW
jgi:tRNA (guanine37-N1)-methyltransferase